MSQLTSLAITFGWPAVVMGLLAWFGWFQLKEVKEDISALRSELRSNIEGVNSRIDILSEGINSRIDNLSDGVNSRIDNLTNVLLQSKQSG